MMCRMSSAVSTTSDTGVDVAAAASAWFEANWDPDLELGAWC